MTIQVTLTLTFSQARLIYALCRKHIYWMHSRQRTTLYDDDIEECRNTLDVIRIALDSMHPTQQIPDMRSLPGESAAQTVDSLLRKNAIDTEDDRDTTITLGRVILFSVIFIAGLFWLALLGD